MSYQFPPDLDRLVKEQMLAGGYTSEDDVLRDALDALGQFAISTEQRNEEYRQAVAAVSEGVADVEAGRMRPLRAIIAEASGRREDFEKYLAAVPDVAPSDNDRLE